mgnify:FL=1
MNDDYPGMVTPQQLRDLADGLANANAAAERVSRLYYAASEMHAALHAVFTDVSSPDTQSEITLETGQKLRAAIAIAGEA